MAAPFQTTGSYTNITSSTKIASAAGELVGIFVAAASVSPTIQVYDNTSAASPVLIGQFTPVAGTWYPMPFQFGTGLYVALGGTVNCTVCTR